MGQRQYPRLGGWTPYKKPRGTCKVEGCGKPATHSITVQWSWMRGEDGIFPVCTEHTAHARTNLNSVAAKLIEDE